MRQCCCLNSNVTCTGSPGFKMEWEQMLWLVLISVAVKTNTWIIKELNATSLRLVYIIQDLRNMLRFIWALFSSPVSVNSVNKPASLHQLKAAKINFTQAAVHPCLSHEQHKHKTSEASETKKPTSVEGMGDTLANYFRTNHLIL